MNELLATRIICPVDKKDLFSIKITNINSNCTLRKLYEECIFLKIGDIVQIVLSSFLPVVEGTHTCIAYMYFKNINPLFAENINSLTEPAELLQLENDPEPWKVEKNNVINHFKTDPHQQKRLLIQSINSNKNGYDINYLFREHGDMEQVDFAWVQSNAHPFPTRAQAYIYFREWGDELFTYKLLEELNDVGVFTIKYDYNGDHDLLWVYELCQQEEGSDDFGYEFGQYRKWLPDDDPKYGSRKDKKNKLNWYFTKAGKFAYAEKIVDDELIKHGGLYIGPEKTFYKVEITRRPLESLWTQPLDNYTYEEPEIELDETEADSREVQKMVMTAIQRCMAITINKQKKHAMEQNENNKKSVNMNLSDPSPDVDPDSNPGPDPDLNNENSSDKNPSKV